MSTVAEFVLVAIAGMGAAGVVVFLTVVAWGRLASLFDALFPPTRRFPRTPACPESDEVLLHRIAVEDAHRLDVDQYRRGHRP